MIRLFNSVLAFSLFLVATITQAKTLPEILRTSLKNAPSLAEARANERIANSRLEQTSAAKWPTVSATGGQRVLSTSNDGGKAFNPSIKGNWTLYDFGKNAAEISRDNSKVDYFNNKTLETGEELIFEISGYYLEALKSKMSLAVAKDDLKRHHEIKRMLETIVRFDPGRRFELTQATSRLLKVESDISNFQRSLGLSLLRIERFTQAPVPANTLADPFIKVHVNDLISRYKTDEADLQKHPSYIAQQKELNSIAAELSVTERSKWPTVDLVGVASTDDATVYLNVDVELFNKVTSPNIDEKRYQINVAQAKLNQIIRDLNERSRLAELKMTQDQSRIFIADNQLKKLKQVAMDYEDQFSIAQRSLLDVVNAYRELATVGLFKVDLQYDLMTAKLDYLSSVGKLREWAGVKQTNTLEEYTLEEKPFSTKLKKESGTNVKNNKTKLLSKTSAASVKTLNTDEPKLLRKIEKVDLNAPIKMTWTERDLIIPGLERLIEENKLSKKQLDKDKVLSKAKNNKASFKSKENDKDNSSKKIKAVDLKAPIKKSWKESDLFLPDIKDLVN